MQTCRSRNSHEWISVISVWWGDDRWADVQSCSYCETFVSGWVGWELHEQISRLYVESLKSRLAAGVQWYRRDNTFFTSILKVKEMALQVSWIKFLGVLEWQRLRLPCLCLQRSNKQTNRERREAHVLVSINAGKSTYCFSWLTKSIIWITTAFAQELWNAPGVLFMSTLWNKLCFFSQ